MARNIPFFQSQTFLPPKLKKFFRRIILMINFETESITKTISAAMNMEANKQPLHYW